MDKKSKKQYIDNKRFLELLKEYNRTNILSEELHMKFWKLASNYAHIPSFRGYTYIDDMIVEGYMRCVRYAKSFDVKTRDNPFAYYTQVIHNVFLNFIAKEKRQQDRKWKSLRLVYEEYIRENNIHLTLPDNIKEKMYKDD